MPSVARKWRCRWLWSKKPACWATPAGGGRPAQDLPWRAVVDRDEEDEVGLAEPAKPKGPGIAARASAAAPILLIAVVTAALTAPVTDWVVNRDLGTDDRQAEARATARVFLPDYERALAGLQAMKKQGRAYVFRVDTTISPADRKALAFSASGDEIGAIVATQLKLPRVWPPGASAPRGAAALKRRWRRDAALRHRVDDALASVDQAVRGLRRVAG